MHSLRGIPLSDFRWPSGDFRDAGTLRLTPEDVEHKLGFSFERGVDDLDYYRALGLELPSGSDYPQAPSLGSRHQIDISTCGLTCAEPDG